MLHAAYAYGVTSWCQVYGKLRYAVIYNALSRLKFCVTGNNIYISNSTSFKHRLTAMVHLQASDNNILYDIK